MRDYKLYLEDILKAIGKIEKYTKGMDFKKLKRNGLVTDGAIRNLEIIGEAVKKMPGSIKKEYSDYKNHVEKRGRGELPGSISRR